jgi:hypothetical protein
LDRFIEISAGIGSGGLPICWDPDILWSDRLLQMMRMIVRIVSVIGLRHCGDVVRGVVELWRDRFSLTIPRIESIHRLEDFDFTEIFWRDMIQESEFSLFLSLGIQMSR